ncbi:MAG TPA: riboflavin synthase [Bacteroidota bacterium]|nr:riboflavin synthase [Bacteroidota bacterium]
MFTGIIQDVGRIVGAAPLGGGIRLNIHSRLAEKLKVSDSVAVNGVCQTVVARDTQSFEVVAVEETLKKTTFSGIKGGENVNLELPVRPEELLGGHLVQGHVDLVAKVGSVEQLATSTVYEIQLPAEKMHYLVHTGSIAVDGVSLTVAEVLNASFKVAIIPHTLDKTIFPEYRPGTGVNIEFDVIGKYIERMLRAGIGQQGGRYSVDDLRANGF